MRLSNVVEVISGGTGIEILNNSKKVYFGLLANIDESLYAKYKNCIVYRIGVNKSARYITISVI